ncbi:hypothetical protein O7627_27510 [Solwaraspora sp. WMMD1047]|uniref:hypothetical protein n=1 Tax=Solwaraspora sp. WMMD1047 TaxID=3016102 RepID=UPI0024167235|nr:hypothetical protein [Solwaraspora sp. WMMD1047]MDG4833025.1 hypothetical protein [Solwaraspora sp. WMMD1047]
MLIAAVVVVLLAAGGVLLAATGEPSSPMQAVSSRPRVVETPRPVADQKIDYRDPDAVCRAFAETVHTVDTTTDAGPTDAYRRAIAYLDETLTGAVADVSTHRPSPRWQRWTQHQVRTQVRLHPYAGDALGPDGDQETHRAVLVSASPVGRDGWRDTETHHTVYCTLRLVADGWRLSGYSIE